MMTNQQLISTEPPYLIVIEAEVSKIIEFGWALELQHPSKPVVRFLRGKKMTTVASLFDEFASALQFPDYFGENWNAFDECITDLSWLPADYYVLIITEAHLVFAKDSEEQWQALTSILENAGDEWATEISGEFERTAKGFHVIFQSSGPEKGKLLSRLRSVGANFQIGSL